jgi:hypothetical protein
VNRYVRRTVRTSGPDDLRGGVKGSFPVDGEYGQFEMLNWACKFFIDSNLLEQAVRDGTLRAPAPAGGSNASRSSTAS